MAFDINAFLKENKAGVAEEEPQLIASEAEPVKQTEFDINAFLQRNVVSPTSEISVSEPEQIEERGIVRAAGDVGVAFTQGGVRGFRSLTDVFGADNPASTALRGVEDYVGNLLSAQAKKDQGEVSRILTEAQDKGIYDQLIAGVEAFATAPVLTTSGAAGSIAVNLLGGITANAASLGIRGIALGAKGLMASQAAIGAAQGAGTIKGEIYDATESYLLEQGMSPEIAKKGASEAQSYGGKNLDSILLGAGLGAAAARFGVEKVATNVILRQGGIPTTKAITRFVTGTLEEMVPEAAQAGQEQLAKNLALQREGADVPTMRGVVGSAAMEGLAGGALGGPTSLLFDKPRGDTPIIKPKGKTPQIIEEEEIDSTSDQVADELEKEPVSPATEMAMKRMQFQSQIDNLTTEIEEDELLLQTIEQTSPDRQKAELALSGKKTALANIISEFNTIPKEELSETITPAAATATPTDTKETSIAKIDELNTEFDALDENDQVGIDRVNKAIAVEQNKLAGFTAIEQGIDPQGTTPTREMGLPPSGRRSEFGTFFPDRPVLQAFVKATDKALGAIQATGKRAQKLKNAIRTGITSNAGFLAGTNTEVISSEEYGKLTGGKQVAADTGTYRATFFNGKKYLVVPDVNQLAGISIEGEQRAASRDAALDQESRAAAKKLEEEVIHLSMFQGIQDEYKNIKNPKFSEQEYIVKRISDIAKEVKRTNPNALPGVSNAYLNDKTKLLDDMTFSQEFMRMVIQRVRTGQITEDLNAIRKAEQEAFTDQDKGLITAWKNSILNALEFVRNSIARYLGKGTSTKEVKKMEDAINNILDEYGIVKGEANYEFKDYSTAEPKGELKAEPPVITPASVTETPAVTEAPAAEVAAVTPTKEVRNIEEASQETGVPQETILTAAQNGEIEAAKVGNDWRLGQKGIDEIKSKLSETITPTEEATAKPEEDFRKRFLAEEVTVTKDDPRFSKSTVKTFSLGQANVIEQKNLFEIVDSPSVFHETNLQSIRNIVSRIKQGPRRVDLWVSNSLDLALGQKGSGYVIELDTKNVNGKVAKSLAAKIMSGIGAKETEIKVNKTLPQSIKSIIAPNNAGVNALRKTAGFEKLFDFDNATQTERGIRIPAKQKTPTPAVSETITPTEEVAPRKPATFPTMPSIEEQTAEKVYGGETGLYDPFAGVQKKRTKAEDPAGRRGTEDQIKNADEHAAEIGGTVLYQDGDISLIRGYSLLGGTPVYIVANKGSRARTDISSYTGNLVTPEQKAQLVDIKNKIEAEDQASFNSKPFITFTDGIAFSNGVPSTIAGVLRGWKSLLNIKANLYITTYDDAVADKDNFNGPHRVIGSAGLASSKTDGSIRKMPNGDFYIMFRGIPSRTKMLETLAHELGHLHQKEAFENADLETKQMLREEHDKWVKSQTGKTAQELISSLRAVKTAKTNLGAAEGIMAEEIPAYWKSFGEWYADQVSRWAVSAEKPLTIVDKFFSRIAKALRSFYANLTNRGFLPNETFVQYLEKTLKEPARIVSETITPAIETSPNTEVESEVVDIENLADDVTYEQIEEVAPATMVNLKSSIKNVAGSFQQFSNILNDSFKSLVRFAQTIWKKIGFITVAIAGASLITSPIFVGSYINLQGPKGRADLRPTGLIKDNQNIFKPYLKKTTVEELAKSLETPAETLDLIRNAINQSQPFVGNVDIDFNSIDQFADSIKPEDFPSGNTKRSYNYNPLLEISANDVKNAAQSLKTLAKDKAKIESRIRQIMGAMEFFTKRKFKDVKIIVRQTSPSEAATFMALGRAGGFPTSEARYNPKENTIELQPQTLISLAEDGIVAISSASNLANELTHNLQYTTNNGQPLGILDIKLSDFDTASTFLVMQMPVYSKNGKLFQTINAESNWADILVGKYFGAKNNIQPKSIESVLAEQPKMQKALQEKETTDFVDSIGYMSGMSSQEIIARAGTTPIIARAGVTPEGEPMSKRGQSIMQKITTRMIADLEAQAEMLKPKKNKAYTEYKSRTTKKGKTYNQALISPFSLAANLFTSDSFTEANNALNKIVRGNPDADFFDIAQVLASPDAELAQRSYNLKPQERFVLMDMIYSLLPAFRKEVDDSDMKATARDSFRLEALNVEAKLAQNIALAAQSGGQIVGYARVLRKLVGAGMAILTYKRGIIDSMGSLAKATNASFNDVANAIRGDRRKSMDKVFNTKEVFKKAVSMIKMAQRNPEKVRQAIRAEVSKKQNLKTTDILLQFASGLFDTKEDKYANMVLDQTVQNILSIGMNKKEFSIDNVTKFMYQSFATAAKQLGVEQAGVEKPKRGKRSGKYMEMVKAVIGNDNAYKSFLNDLASRMAEKYQSRDAFNADFAELFTALRSNEWADGLREQAIKDTTQFLNYKFADLFTYLGSQRNVNQEAVKQHIRAELQGTGASNELIEKFIQDTDKYLNEETSRILQDKLGFRIDEKTGKVIPKPLLSSKIKEEAEEQFKAIKNLKDISKLSTSDEGNFIEALISRIITEVGMDKEQATELATLISTQMEKAMLAQRSENVDRAIKDAQVILNSNGVKPKTNQRTVLQKLIEMANMGVLDAEGVYEAFRKTHDFPKGFLPYDADFTNTLREWGDRISKLPPGVIRSIEEEKMGRALMEKSKFTIGDILSSYWYFSLLSQVATQGINALSGASNLMANVAVWSLYNPKSFFPMMRAMYHAIDGRKSPAVNSFLYVMRNGLNPSGMQDEKRAKYPKTNVLESATPENTPKIVYYLTNFGDGKINFLPDWMNTALKNVNPRQLMRVLRATDMFLREVAYEAKAAQIGAADFSREGFDMAKRQAESELFSSDATGKQKEQEIIIRANEIYREQRLDETGRAIAEQASLETAFNQQPVGLFGLLANGVNYLLGKYPATKFVIPFTNVVANVTNEFINYTPVFSQIRLIGSKRRGVNDPFTQGSAEKQMEMAIKGGVGMLIMVPFIIQALTGGDDEDQEERPYIQFYAEGPKDPRQKKIWQQRGGQKYSVRVGNTYFSYLSTPLVIPLAMGAMLQEEIKSMNKKGKKVQSEDIGKLAASVLTAPFSVGFVAVLNQSFLTGLADLLEFKESQNPVEKGTQVVGGILSRMAVPGVFRDINKLYTEDKAIGSGYLSNFLKDFPGSVNFLNKDVNYFGDDAKFPSAVREEGFGKRLASVVGRIVSTEQPDPAFEVMYRNNLTPPSWDASLSWDNGKRMTKEQELQFIREAGPLMRERIVEVSDELDELPIDEAQDLLSTEIRIIRREVKEDLQDRLEIPLDIE